jgi:ankyrin repeat protein
VEVAELLLRHGAYPNARDGDGHTPLYYAARNACLDGVLLLLKHGAVVYPEVLDVVTSLEESREILRLRGVVKRFAERGVLSMCNEACETPLHNLHKYDYYKQLWLLEFGGDPNVRDRHGRTPLHYAIMLDRPLRLLLDHGADPNAQRQRRQDAASLRRRPQKLVRREASAGVRRRGGWRSWRRRSVCRRSTWRR